MTTDNERRSWYFTIRDFDDEEERIDAEGNRTDSDSAKMAPFIGTGAEAEIEACRRADLWEARNHCCSQRVTYHSLGKVTP